MKGVYSFIQHRGGKRCINMFDMQWLESRRTLCHEIRFILSVNQTDDYAFAGDTGENVACSKCKKPSPQPQALPLGDDSATQSCHSEAPQCLGGPAQNSFSDL